MSKINWVSFSSIKLPMMLHQPMGEDSGLLMLLSISMVYVALWIISGLLGISHCNTNKGYMLLHLFFDLNLYSAFLLQRIELIAEVWTAPPLNFLQGPIMSSSHSSN